MIIRTFQVDVSAHSLAAIASSVGAHVAAKLAVFDSDERVLTDELCDMFCSWSLAANNPAHQQVPITLTKVTQRLEAIIGADLEIVLTSPVGMKRVLAQAKVIDPTTHELRGSDAADLEKLRQQLARARQSVADLAFFMAYVPGSDLNGEAHGFGTWEQAYSMGKKGQPNSRLGVSLVNVSTLIDQSNNWLHQPPFSCAPGNVHPAGLSLAELLLALIACQQGSWMPIDHRSRGLLQGEPFDNADFNSYRIMGMDGSKMSEETWSQFSAVAGQALTTLRRDRERGSL